MSFARRLAKLRLALIVPVALSALASAPTFAREVYIQQPPPPPMRVERPPMGRHGYAWDQGHWRWDGRAYAWAPGHWQPMRGPGRWEPGHWEARGPRWFWVEGHWLR
jgi:hypothetical protein